ncbi:MAG: hypothetical protein H6P96_439, partial [Candidatus Aminicenantes bacterium]|nr:hypothetical protein [Candidatus Aminicenantes bacterium]
MDGTVLELQDGPPLTGIEPDRARPRHDQPGIRRIPAHVGEDVPPGAVRPDAADEKDDVGQDFVELQRLDLEPDPGDDRVGHGPDPGAVGPGREDEGERQGQEKGAEPEEGDGPGQPPLADADRLEGDDLGIGRKPGQPAQDAHQDGHRQGEGQDGRDEETEDAQSPEERHALVDEELGQEQDLVHQQDEGDEQETDE